MHLPYLPLSLWAATLQAALDYTLARKIDRYQAQDVMSNVFENFVELSGDGKASDDFCLKGGLARIGGVAVVVMGTVKGHTPGDMQAANYGERRLEGRGGEERGHICVVYLLCFLGFCPVWCALTEQVLWVGTWSYPGAERSMGWVADLLR